jgi:hypothetical protein
MVDGADLTKTDMQFNYMDGQDFVFMNMESFETENVKADTIGDQSKWLKEGTDVSILKFGEKILDIEIPQTMVLEVRAGPPIPPASPHRPLHPASHPLHGCFAPAPRVPPPLRCARARAISRTRRANSPVQHAMAAARATRARMFSTALATMLFSESPRAT